jgi:hypothetical protein
MTRVTRPGFRLLMSRSPGGAKAGLQVAVLTNAPVVKPAEILASGKIQDGRHGTYQEGSRPIVTGPPTTGYAIVTPSSARVTHQSPDSRQRLAE